jgi:serine/threonine-protein kinase RsbW
LSSRETDTQAAAVTAGCPGELKNRIFEKKMDNPEVVILDIPAETKYLETVSGLIDSTLERMDQPTKDPQANFAIKLSVHEACTNIIEHAYHGNPGRIRIAISLYQTAARKIIIELSDQGDAAIIAKFKQPDLDHPQIKGYGLFLMKQLVDTVEYIRDGGTNRWKLVKAI